MSPPSRPATILIIDDDPLVVASFAKMLQLSGYAVQTAMDVETGLKKAETFRPAAILLDFRMPLSDGLAFLQRLRALEHLRDTPVAIVTGDYMIDEPMLAALRALGAAVHFKPLWLDDLMALARQLVPN